VPLGVLYPLLGPVGPLDCLEIGGPSGWPCLLKKKSPTKHVMLPKYLMLDKRCYNLSHLNN